PVRMRIVPGWAAGPGALVAESGMRVPSLIAAAPVERAARHANIGAVYAAQPRSVSDGRDQGGGAAAQPRYRDPSPAGAGGGGRVSLDLAQGDAVLPRD